MRNKMSFVLSVALVSIAVFSSHALSADVTGVWKTEFESQIGLQKYTFTLTQEGTRVGGKALANIDGEKREIELKDGKLDGDTITFVEILDFQGSELRISYTGKVSGDEIKMTRQVGEFATEEIVMKRVKDETKPAVAPEPQRPNPYQPVVLSPDDKPAFAPAPAGFDVKRENIEHGKIEMVEYDSKTVGNKRKMMIYTPPGYSKDNRYPVLYLLHSIGGDETEWYKNASPEVILDNLYADKKLAPMIVIMPNGRAQPNDRAEGDVFRSAPAFENFEKDLLNDVIPFVETNYSVKKDRQSRAIAGLSMGGGQTLNFGLGNLDIFAWVGAFSSAPNTKAPQQLAPDLDKTAKQLKLLWISCGDKDGLMHISQGVHTYLKQNKVPHIWHVDSGKHDFHVWKNDLYWFSQLLFRENP